LRLLFLECAKLADPYMPPCRQPLPTGPFVLHAANRS
jgi:hypothetical protein